MFKTFNFILCFTTVYLNAQSILLPEKVFAENYSGKEVNDLYRYIENPNDTIVQEWFKQNNVQARDILDNISGRKEIVDKLIELEKRRSFSILDLNITNDNYYFYLKKTDTDKTEKLYYKASEKGIETLLYDSAEYKKGQGDEYIITYIKPSWDNKTVALGLSKNGEEIGEIAFLTVSTKTFLPEIINHCWPAEFEINWLPDNSGIIYQHIPVIDPKDKNYILNMESVRYKLGDDASNHIVLFSKENNPEINIKSEDFPLLAKYEQKDKYILGYLGGASYYSDYYYAEMDELNKKRINWKLLFKKEDKIKNQIIIGNDIYCLSSKNASNFKIFKTKISHFDWNKAEIIVPESKTESINDFVITKDGLFYSTTKNGVEARLYYVGNNGIKEITLPIAAGKIVMHEKNKFSSELWVTINGWLDSKKRYQYDIVKDKFTKADLTPVIAYPEFQNFVVEEIEIASYDGALVPVSLIYKKGLKKDKMNNVLINGYGSFGISVTPLFRPNYLLWVLYGGVYALAHVRGGGEKGDNWHKAGYKVTKPNTWKDLIATAEYLIKEKITSKEKIAISGVSAGGILVGRAMIERPDLFKVMLCYNGELNPLRNNIAPNGPNNMKEFGNPEIKEEFDALYNMDSYNQLKKGVDYPACLITTGINDARVAPWMSGKFVAKLQLYSTSKNPVLLKVNYDAGHGLDSSNLQLYNDYADGLAFAFWQMGHPKFKLMKKE